MKRFLQIAFFLIVVRPLLAVVLGTNIRHAERLPRKGPAILAANHNSHLDTLLLMSMYPLTMLHRIRPVAAADYFLHNRALAWFALNIIHIIPLERSHKSMRGDFANIEAALAVGDIVLLFPEGTRGEPEKRGKLKSGIVHLMEHLPNVPVVPVYMHGLGKALPKGEWLPIPFFADVFVGETLHWRGDRTETIEALERSFATIESNGQFSTWE
ncbi:MAG: lysophospholipid acyltransferase family protein [Polyangiaceae bacterium]